LNRSRGYSYVVKLYIDEYAGNAIKIADVIQLRRPQNHLYCICGPRFNIIEDNT